MTTQGIGTVGLDRTAHLRESTGPSTTDEGELAGRKVTAGGVLKTIGRVLLGIATLGISELVIHLVGRSARRETALPENARARHTLEGHGDGVERSKGKASRAFRNAVQGSINDKFGPKGDLSMPGKFEAGVHKQFRLDANRATYRLNGEELPRSGAVVIEALREAMSPEELQAVTAVLHQGASLAVLEQCGFSRHGFVQGLLGTGAGGKTSSYSLSRTEKGTFEVRIEDRMPVNNLTWMDESGLPHHRHFDDEASLLRTVIHGEIRPGKDPLFVITKPIEYDLRLKPQG